VIFFRERKLLDEMSQMSQVQFKFSLNFEIKMAGKKILTEIWIMWRFKRKLNIVLTVYSAEQGRITFYQCKGCKLGLERGYFFVFHSALHIL
jgi:hypothetical protein